MFATSSLCYAEPEIKGKSALLASLKSQQIVYSKNSDAKVAPAEFTKLMTAYTTYKIYGTDKVITVAENIGDFTNYPETRMNLKAGEALSSESLIYGMLMGQANDAAVAVALNYGGIDDFVARMNDYAKGLGMANTKFTNVTGSNDENQYTTADDLLKLFRAFYADKNLYAFLSRKSVTIPATNLSSERTYWTKNHLMSRFIYLDYYYDYALAGISSSSSYGGYSVISSAEKGTKELVCIVLNSVYENGVNYSMPDAMDLFNYGFDKFSTVTVTKQGDLLYEAELKNQRGRDTMLLVADSTLKALILDDDSIESIEKEVIVDEPVSAPLKKGDKVGKVVYKYKGNIVGEINLDASEDVNRSIIKTIFSGFKWFFGLKAVKIVILVLLCAVGIFFALILNTANKGKRRNRKR